MEDIKNIDTPKARYQAKLKERANRRRNRKPTSFFEFFTIDLSKTPAGKARAKAEEKSKKTTVSDEQKRRQGKSGPSRKTTVSDAQKKRQTMKLPKSPPKRLKKNLDKPTSQTAKKPESKKSEKMYHQINTQTGKVDFSKPKVTAAKRLQQEDKYKAFKLLNKTAKQSLKKKGK